ncbi:hypothetical protein KI387_014645, partial [Taxus chinensis]
HPGLSLSAIALLLSGDMSFVGFPFVALRGQFRELADVSAIDRRRLAMIFKYSSITEAEAIEAILGDSYRFNARHPRTDSDVASAFVSFCTLLHPNISEVELVASDLIYAVHCISLHDQLVDFSLPDPLLWVEDVDELAIGSGRDIRWLSG